MEFANLGEVQLILLIAIACGTAVGLATFLLARRRQNAPAPDDTSFQAPEPAQTDAAPRSRLQPDDRARAVALINELTTASRRDGMS